MLKPDNSDHFTCAPLFFKKSSSGFRLLPCVPPRFHIIMQHCYKLRSSHLNRCQIVCLDLALLLPVSQNNGESSIVLYILAAQCQSSHQCQN